MTARTRKPKPGWQTAAAEVLRYVFFAGYCLCLAAMVYGARSISNFQENQDRLRETRIKNFISEKKLLPSPAPVAMNAMPLPQQPEASLEITASPLPEGEHAAV